MRDDDPLNPPDDREDSESEELDESQTEDSAEETGGDDTSDGGTSGGEKANVTAPSIGPDTVIERKPPEERLDFDKISDEDAMGHEKRRQVVGGTYGPTRARVFATFATFFAVVAALVVGLYFLAKELDQPPKESPAKAPWAQEGADQKKPRPLE